MSGSEPAEKELQDLRAQLEQAEAVYTVQRQAAVEKLPERLADAPDKEYNNELRRLLEEIGDEYRAEQKKMAEMITASQEQGLISRLRGQPRLHRLKTSSEKQLATMRLRRDLVRGELDEAEFAQSERETVLHADPALAEARETVNNLKRRIVGLEREAETLRLQREYRPALSAEEIASSDYEI